MSDATLGTLVLFSPVAVVILLWPQSRRMVSRPIYGALRLVALLLAVAGILLVGGEPKRVLLESIHKHSTDPDTPGRHARTPAYLDTAPVPATQLEPYSPEWYDVIYEMQD